MKRTLPLKRSESLSNSSMFFNKLSSELLAKKTGKRPEKVHGELLSGKEQQALGPHPQQLTPLRSTTPPFSLLPTGLTHTETGAESVFWLMLKRAKGKKVERLNIFWDSTKSNMWPLEWNVDLNPPLPMPSNYAALLCMGDFPPPPPPPFPPRWALYKSCLCAVP